VLEETVRNLEGHLESEEAEKLAAYERETQLNSKVTNIIYQHQQQHQQQNSALYN